MSSASNPGRKNRGPGHPYEIKNSPDSKEPAVVDLHPSESSRGTTNLGGRDLPAWAGSRGLESDFKRCRQCGYVFDLIITPSGSGYGNIATSEAIPGSSTGLKNPVVGGGCPFCGSSSYIPGLEEAVEEHAGTGFESEMNPGDH